jgi:hypothetical protein
MTFGEFDRLPTGSKVSFFDQESQRQLDGIHGSYTMNREIHYAKLNIIVENEGCKQTYFGIDHKIVDIGWTKKPLKLKFRFHV